MYLPSRTNVIRKFPLTPSSWCRGTNERLWSRRKAPTIRIPRDDRRQARSDISCPSTGASLVFFAGASFARDFLRLDFVEVVLTYSYNFRVTTEEVRVYCQHRMFLRIDYNIVDPVFAEQAFGV